MNKKRTIIRIHKPEKSTMVIESNTYGVVINFTTSSWFHVFGYIVGWGLIPIWVILSRLLRKEITIGIEEIKKNGQERT